MSSPNLELVRAIYAAWERGDFSDASWADPEIEFLLDDGVSVTRRTGLAGMAQAWGNFLRDWEGWATTVEEYRELGGGRVLVLLGGRGRGRSSGVEIERFNVSGANVFKIRDGKVTKLDVYLDRESAFVDLSVESPAPSENVEVARRSRELWNAGDLDSLRALYDPHIILRGVEDWPEPGPFIGADAVIEQWKRLREAWDEGSLSTMGDSVAVGDRVATRFVWKATGRGPGFALEQTIVSTIRNGKIIAAEFFWDHAEALATMGIERPEPQPESLQPKAARD